ncbi:MAG: DUF167 domain-containing protein [Xenococcaceae cyanobacterium]
MKISVKVKPNSKQQKIVRSDEGTWIIHLKSPPIDGKANQELIQLLAKQFKIARAQISIKSGLSSKIKLIEIEE